MKTRKILLCQGVAVLCFGLAGCSISLSGGASLNAGGDGAVIEGTEPIAVQAAQPELPAQPPKPVPPKKAKLVGKKIVITEKVMFDYDKATIKAESNELLSDVGEIIKKFPTIKKVSIEGHTDTTGKAKYNKKLSQKRANAVKEFLVKLGIDGKRLEAIGHGEENPIDPSKGEEANEKNRRVEFNIQDGEAVEMIPAPKQ